MLFIRGCDSSYSNSSPASNCRLISDTSSVRNSTRSPNFKLSGRRPVNSSAIYTPLYITANFLLVNPAPIINDCPRNPHAPPPPPENRRLSATSRKNRKVLSGRPHICMIADVRTPGADASALATPLQSYDERFGTILV